jgi:release factor glutamine methyltransferase
MQLKELYQFGKESLGRNSIETPALEAYLLLSETDVINNISEIYTFPEKEINQDTVDEFHELINRRINREPIAYIAGEKEFYSRPFKVNPSVLIPRPETEILVEETLRLAKLVSAPLILEIGTGSGCIAITLSCEYKNAGIVASDISQEALSIAKENTYMHEQSKRISLVGADLTSSFKNNSFDIVVSNPPYISEWEFAQLEPDVKGFEPVSALLAEDGLYYIRKIISGSKRILKDDGWCVLEIGRGQEKSVKALFKEYGFTEISSTKDLNGIERVIKAKWKK